MIYVIAGDRAKAVLWAANRQMKTDQWQQINDPHLLRGLDRGSKIVFVGDDWQRLYQSESMVREARLYFRDVSFQPVDAPKKAKPRAPAQDRPKDPDA